MKSIIEITNLSFRYGKRLIMENVNFQINPGEFVSIKGESGTGKSTLLYLLARFVRPNSGNYLFDGKKPEWAPVFRRKNIGFLFQDFRLLNFLTLEKNIAFPKYFSGIHISSKKINDLMQKLNIDHRRSAYPDSISGGEAQRTALARALLLNPKILLLDEPSGNLDSDTEKKLISIFKELKNDGKTLICVTHSKEIMKASDRIFELKDKKIQEVKKRKVSQKSL